MLLLLLLFITAIACQQEDAPGYRVDEANLQQTQNGWQISLLINRNVSYYGNAISELVVDVEFETTERIHVKIYDKDKRQAQVPNSRLGFIRPTNNLNQGKRRKGTANNRNPGSMIEYELKYATNPFGFKVVMNHHSSNTTTDLFDTTNLPFVFEDTYLEMSTRLPDRGVTISEKYSNKKNKTSTGDESLFRYGVQQQQAFYIDVRHNTTALGVFLLNSHRLNITNNGAQITYKTFGGILDFYFFLPKDGKAKSVTQAYANFVGKPLLPAHWMLGYHHLHPIFLNVSSMENIVNIYKQQRIPLETHWIQANLTDALAMNDSSNSIALFSKQLHDSGRHIAIMADPIISIKDSHEAYFRGLEQDVFVKTKEGSLLKGKFGNEDIVFPDWWSPNITTYWTSVIAKTWMPLFMFDGIELGTCQEESVFSFNEICKTNNNSYANQFLSSQYAILNEKRHYENQVQQGFEYPTFATNSCVAALYEKPQFISAMHYGNISHDDVYNLNGHAGGYITREAMQEYNNASVRPLVSSCSIYVGSGKYMGHLARSTELTWQILRSSISTVFNLQIYGMSYSGIEFYGFSKDNISEELYIRWIQLSAFYPFARNTYSMGDATSPKFWEAIRTALNVRYSLLPYLYTVFEESSRLGTTVWRPLILLGSDMLISPVLAEHALQINDAQFPLGLWYDWYNHSTVIKSVNSSTYHSLVAPLTRIPIHIRGGSIIATKTPKLLVQDTFMMPYNLIIALDEKKQAVGRLYVDDGQSLKVVHKSNIQFIFTESLGNITILDLESIPYLNATVIKNGVSKDKTFVLEKQGNQATIITDGSISLVEKFSMKFV
ncbi:MAG: alpha glucosidase [Benjaminiella poitrasii]|nr:MAG: alpha glucosidase [Benjaminiella poitrasii]